MHDLDAAVEAVKKLLRLGAEKVCFNSKERSALTVINEGREAMAAVLALPKLEATGHPYYFSIDDGGRTGLVIEGHLDPHQMLGVPFRIATELMDDLCSTCGAIGMYSSANDEAKRSAFLQAYGPEMAEILCRGIDEGLRDHSIGFRRFRNHDGSKIRPLSDSSDGDEYYFETVEADAEHACPVTVFDFYEAAEDAATLIDERDQAAVRARRGESARFADGEALDAWAFNVHLEVNGREDTKMAIGGAILDLADLDRILQQARGATC